MEVGKIIMDTNFCEKFGKKEIIKGLFFVVLFMVLAGMPISKTENDFIKFNYNAIVYVGLFFVLVVLFNRQIVESFKNICMDGNRLSILLFLWFGMVASQILVAIVLNTINIPNYNRIGLDEDTAKGIYNLSMLATIICGPVVEEFIYRYWIYRIMRDKHIVLAYIINICLFALSHIWGGLLLSKDFRIILNMFIYVPIGVVTTIAYEKYKNILYPVILHMALNAVAFF